MRISCLVLCFVLFGALYAATPVTVSVAQVDGKDVVTMSNYRVKLAITPARGGAVTSYSDLLAPGDVLLPKPYMGLCMDHFQEQNWPGELLEVPYDYKVLLDTPEEARVMVSRKATGLWQSKLVNTKLSDILLEKTYILRADSPTLTCAVKLTMPAESAKTFSYWMQNVMFAGGDYDPATDRTFRPSSRGVRNSGNTKNGMYGTEEWLRDFTDGWMVLLDTRKKSGLAMTAEYDDLRISYACGGNTTNELMFNTTYLPKGQSRTYTLRLTPVVGLENVLTAGRRLLVGYRISTDNKGNGQLEFQAARAADAVSDVTFTATVVGAATGKDAPGGTVVFPALTDRPQVKTLALKGIPLDPIVLRVVATGHTAAGAAFTDTFEDFFPGAYSWGDNIQTDMRSPVYAAARPPQKLTLAKPATLKLRPEYNLRVLYFNGMLDEEYNIPAAIHIADYTPKTDVIYYSYDGSWYGALTDFPYDYDKLLTYSSVILGGISSSGLKPVGVEMLHDYLLAGGGMIVLGGHGAYGRALLKGTKLGDAFPVDFAAKAFDMVPTGGKPVVYGPDTAPFLKYTALGDRATCWFLHTATAKPGTQVLMQVDGKPFMVAGEYGPNKARIVCILGAPMGDAARGQVAFWKDPQWYMILRNAFWWIAQKDQHFNE